MNSTAARWDNQSNFAEMINLASYSPPKSAGPLFRQSWYFENQYSPTSSTVLFEEKGLCKALSNFTSYLIENSKDIEPEYVRIVEENFWDLLA